MAVNFSADLYSVCQDTFGRPAVFMSTSGNSYSGAARGIYESYDLNIPLENGSITTDQRTIFDIRAAEFPVLPQQDDTVYIPEEPLSGLPELGNFEIINVWHNGGGEVTLQLRKVMP